MENKKYSFRNYLNQLCPRLTAAFGSIAKFFVDAQNLIACTARAWRGGARANRTSATISHSFMALGKKIIF